MFERMHLLVKNHFNENIVLYGITLFIFLVGLTSGAFTINAISLNQREGLANYVDNFIGHVNEDPKVNIDRAAIFLEGLRQYCGFAFWVWILGISYIGMPFIAFILGTRGFLIGFTTGFLISSYGIKGVLFVALCMLPQNLIYIPCIFIISIMAFKNAILDFSNRKVSLVRKLKSKEFTLYTKKILLTSIFLLIGIIYEVLITPFIMNVFLRIL
ncbi:MAG: stage II sporulation protein M [Clostridiales bacterium]|nr:stage II sporulation protein M [Clostridiales bacterium]